MHWITTVFQRVKTKIMKKIFIICTVRGATEEYRKNLEQYVSLLESQGCQVHLPHRDTDQNASGYNICDKNATAIANADEVHIFYNGTSQGTHFDMGVAFAFGKPLIVVHNETYGEGKSYARMIVEWQVKNGMAKINQNKKRFKFRRNLTSDLMLLVGSIPFYIAGFMSTPFTEVKVWNLPPVVSGISMMVSLIILAYVITSAIKGYDSINKH